MLSPAEAKEKILKALSLRRVIERGWLTALLGYLIKREEVEVRLKYIGDIKLQRKDFEALAMLTYYAATWCQPGLPEELARTFSRSLEPRKAFSLLLAGLSLASYACKKQSTGNKVSINVSPERVSLEVNGVSVSFNPNCVSAALPTGVFVKGEYEIPEVLSGLKGREAVDVGANIGDSALYFILHGARKVIAVEPLPNVAKCAEENVRLSGAADKVKVLNAALSSGPVNVPCDYDLSSSAGFSTLKGSGSCRTRGS
ncbi:MAG: FkbM family methyltransferase [Acidilobus sp.]